MIKIKKFRLDQNMTQAQLAEKVGVVPSTITQYESGNREPKLSILKKIADALNVSIDELVESVDKHQKNESEDL